MDCGHCILGSGLCPESLDGFPHLWRRYLMDDDDEKTESGLLTED